MMNALDAYRDCGRRCGKARNEEDEARARFEWQHYKKMRALECGSKIRQAADMAFNAGYLEVRYVKPLLD